ncbi:hypothetical protein HCB17_06155 [Salinispora arenicola]|nr:hypothetical protein [Salinispora arenicola]
MPDGIVPSGRTGSFYTEHWLRREGFAARQFRRRRENEPEGGERTGFHPDGDC